MILLIDIGNTRIKWALLSGDEIFAHGSCTLAEIDTLVDQVVAAGGKPEETYLACVADNTIIERIGQLVKRQWAGQVLSLTAGNQCCGVTNGYDDPARLGVDRWAAIVGARQRFSGPLCVVDCGSAVTVDALTAEGRHLGGYIVPGLAMQRELLRQGTAAVNVTPAGTDDISWGRDTVNGVARGSAEAVAGLIERSTRLMTVESGGAVSTIVTGGDATGILPLLTVKTYYEEHLVLQGMACMVRALRG